MKAIFSVCLFFLTYAGLYAQQDTSKIKSPRSVFFHFSNGISTLRSEQLQSRYGTKALYYWGVGVRFGNPEKDAMLLAFDYSQSSYTVRSEVNSRAVDSLLRIDQVVPSFSFRMIEGKEFVIRARTGFIYCILTDDMHGSEKDHYKGFKIGLGLERKCFRNQYVYVGLDYDLIRPSGGTFRDYDAVKLGIGIYL